MIRAARAEDAAQIAALLDAAFEGPTEAALVDALRAEGAVVAELVAEAAGTIAGQVLFSRAPVGGASVVALAPLAVAADASVPSQKFVVAAIRPSLPSSSR